MEQEERIKLRRERDSAGGKTKRRRNEYSEHGGKEERAEEDKIVKNLE